VPVAKNGKEKIVAIIGNIRAKVKFRGIDGISKINSFRPAALIWQLMIDIQSFIIKIFKN
jgi:hypothetical protein